MADPRSDYPYAPDRFDREAETTSFHGAHRAEEPFWRQNLLYIVVIGAAVLTLLVLLFVIGGMNGNDGSGEDSSSPAAASSAPAQPASDAGGAPAAAEEPNRGTGVVVYNASGENGLAGAWRDKLTADGWTKVDIKTSSNRQEQAVVFYRDEADAATANALAQEVGLEGAQQSDEYDSSITFLAVTPPEG